MLWHKHCVLLGMKNFNYILLLIMLSLTQVVFSQQPDTDSTETKEISEAFDKPLFGSEEHKQSLGILENKTQSSDDIIVKTCLSLSAVIGLILLIFYALKKVNNKVYSNGNKNPLRVFSRLPLDGKNYLTLVRVYEEEFLLSVGPNGSTVVARYALIENEEGDNITSVSTDGAKPFILDDETHVTSINLQPFNEKRNETQN